MSDSSVADIEAEAHRLIELIGKPTRRARPRLAPPLQDADDLEVATPAGPVMAWRLGEGPATLMVHGWEDDNALWGPLIDVCSGMLRASVAFDQPGHGWSPAETCSIEDAGQAVLAVAAAFGPIDSVVAHSFGCLATIWALTHGLDVSRAVMIASPTPPVDSKSRGLDGWAKLQVKKGVDPVVVARALDIIAERASARAEPPFTVEDVLPTLTAKALIVHSIDDQQCSVGHSQRMAELWPGAELLLFDNLGHRIVAQNEDVLARVFEFIDGPD